MKILDGDGRYMINNSTKVNRNLKIHIDVRKFKITVPA